MHGQLDVEQDRAREEAPREREPDVAPERDDALEAVLARHLEHRRREGRVVLDDEERRGRCRRDASRRSSAISPSGSGVGRHARQLGGLAAASVGERAPRTSAGRRMVNVLPFAGSLSTRTSPPRRRASSRLIDRPRPVPPYLRLVVPSACWNASKMSCCLSFAMPMPVSVTENAMTLSDAARTGFAEAPCPARRGARAAVTPPCSVNLNALPSRFGGPAGAAGRRCGS